MEDEEGNVLSRKGNVKRPKRIQKYGRLLLAVVLLTFLVGAIPIGGWAYLVWKENTHLSSKVTGLEAELVAAKAKLDETRRNANRETHLDYIRNEIRGAMATYADVFAEVQTDPYWPGLGPESRGAAELSIKTHMQTIQRHLMETTRFNRWLNARLPPEFHAVHSPVLDALNEFAARCLPQLKQVHGKSDLSLLKQDVEASLKDLLEKLNSAMPKERITTVSIPGV